MSMNPKRRPGTDEERKTALIKTSGRCAVCGKQLHYKEATIEHIFPLSKGGTYEEYNLTVLCEKCNLNKSDTMADISYYRFIEPEFRPLYKKKHEELITKYDTDKILVHDPEIFRFMPDIALQMFARQSKNKQMKMLNPTSIRSLTKKVELTRAYEADAEKIANFIQGRIKSKYFIGNRTFYDSDYRVYEDIRACFRSSRNSEVLMMESKGELCGCILIKDAADFEIFHQLENLAENANLTCNRVITGIYAESSVAQAMTQIMDFLIARFATIGSLPIFFLSEEYAENPIFAKFMKFPFRLENYDALLMAPTKKDLCEWLAEIMSVVYNEYRPDELYEFAELWLENPETLDRYQESLIEGHENLRQELKDRNFSLKYGLSHTITY